MAYNRFAYYYDRLMEDTPYDDWLRFLERFWQRHGHPEHVVDLGCGTGNIAIPLAQTGIRVTGIDLSEEMLAVASGKSGVHSAGRLRNPIEWVQQDIREWELPEPADAVISFCDCFNYLTRERDITRAFRRTYEGLKPGGRFLFDMHTPLQLRNYAEAQPFILNDDDIAYIWTCELAQDVCELEHALTIFVRDGERDAGDEEERFLRIEEVHRQRAYPLDWLVTRLGEAGFTEIECFGDFRLEPPTAETERVFIGALRE